MPFWEKGGAAAAVKLRRPVLRKIRMFPADPEAVPAARAGVAAGGVPDAVISF